MKPSQCMLLFALLIPALCGATAATEPHASIVELRKIWDSDAPVTSTDLVWFRDQWICVLETEVGLKVIGSDDGKSWRELSTLTSDTILPLRSARLSATTDGRIMLNAVAPGIPNGGQSKSWFSYDAVKWKVPVPMAEDNYLVSNVSWHVGVAYNFQYGSTCGNAGFRIGTSHDHGQSFQVKHEETDMFGAGKGALVFSQDYGYCVLPMHRGENIHGLIGVSKAPFWQWKWQKLPTAVRHPNAIRTKSGAMFVVAGLPDESGTMRSTLCQLDPVAIELVRIATIPSNKPCFVGLATRDDQVYLAYLNDADNGSAVHMAKVSYK